MKQLCQRKREKDRYRDRPRDTEKERHNEKERERQFIDAKKRFPSKSIETPTTSVKK